MALILWVCAEQPQMVAAFVSGPGKNLIHRYRHSSNRQGYRSLLGRDGRSRSQVANGGIKFEDSDHDILCSVVGARAVSRHGVAFGRAAGTDYP